MTSISKLPTNNRVGATTWGRYSPARSGRPPRETTAAMSFGSLAAAIKAAAAPVLAPKYPKANLFVKRSIPSHSVTPMRRSASNVMLKRYSAVARPFLPLLA